MMRRRLSASLAFLGAALPAPLFATVLSFQEAASAPGLANVGNVIVSPDGRNVYATSGRAGGPIDGPTLVVLSRDALGRLTFVQLHYEGQAPGPFCGAGALAVSPDGRNVYVAATCAQRVRMFSRDENTGRVSPIGSVDHQADRPDGLADLFMLACSPDGRSVYTVDSRGTTLGVFRRDPDSGQLTYVEGHVMPAGLVASFPIGTIAVSPDARNVYVPVDAGERSALFVFSRDSATGALLPEETERDGVNQFTSIADFRSTAISRDGGYLYTGFLSDPECVVPVFRRDRDSGKLTVIEARPSTAPFSARSIAISPDGSFLYAGGDYRLTVLRRNVTTGSVRAVDSYDHTFGIVDGLYLIGGLVGAMGVAVSPDSRDVYTAAGNDGVVGHFRRLCGNGRLDPGEDCDDGNGEDGDGCSALCTAEPCFTCSGEPSLCAPADGNPCDDGNPCTTAERCAHGACTGGVPASDGTVCDDGDACTVGDRCLAGVCRGDAPLGCGPCQTCDRRFGCVGFVRTDCHESPAVGPHGSITMRAAGSGPRVLRWRWAGTEPFPLADFGNPSLESDGDYALCIYDHDGLLSEVRRRRAVVAAVQVRAGDSCGRKRCWHASRNGFRYRDAAATVDGVTDVVVRRKAPPLSLEARGDRLSFRAPPLARDVTAEFTAPTGACWRADYRAFVRKNAPGRFIARGGLKSPCEAARCE